MLLGLGAVLATALIVAGEARRFGVDAVSPGSRKWRVLGIGLVLVAGVASVMAYLREGIPPDDPWRNPLATLLPVLGPLAVAVAVGLVVPRLVGPAHRDRARASGWAGWSGCAGRPVTPVPSPGLGLVVTIALTVTGLGLAVDRGLTAGIDEAGWRQVGAPMRIDTRDPEVAAAIGELGSVTVAPSGVSVLRVESPEIATTVDLINLDMPLHALLTSGSVADLHLPDLSGADPVPVVAAHRLDDRLVDGRSTHSPGPGRSRRHHVPRGRDPPGDAGAHRGLAARRPQRARVGVLDREPPIDTLYLDAAPGGRRRPRRARRRPATPSCSDREEVVAAAADDPLVRAVRWSYLGTGLLALG